MALSTIFKQGGELARESYRQTRARATTRELPAQTIERAGKLLSDMLSKLDAIEKEDIPATEKDFPARMKLSESFCKIYKEFHSYQVADDSEGMSLSRQVGKIRNSQDSLSSSESEYELYNKANQCVINASTIKQTLERLQKVLVPWQNYVSQTEATQATTLAESLSSSAEYSSLTDDCGWAKPKVPAAQVESPVKIEAIVAAQPVCVIEPQKQKVEISEMPQSEKIDSQKFFEFGKSSGIGIFASVFLASKKSVEDSMIARMKDYDKKNKEHAAIQRSHSPMMFEPVVASKSLDSGEKNTNSSSSVSPTQTSPSLLSQLLPHKN